MRAALLRESLLDRSPASVAWLLNELASPSPSRTLPFQLTQMAAVDLFTDDALPLEFCRQIFQVASAHELYACMDLLRSTESQEPKTRNSAPRSLIPGGRPLTLGERKSLARVCKHSDLMRLLLDPHKDVIALLLSNPRLQEEHVLRIISSARLPAPLLLLVAKHKRWICRPRIRLALLQNPRLPTASCLRLSTLLNQSELKALLLQSRLPASVLAVLRQRLAKSPRPPSQQSVYIGEF